MHLYKIPNFGNRTQNIINLKIYKNKKQHYLKKIPNQNSWKSQIEIKFIWKISKLPKSRYLPRIPWTMTTRWSADAVADSLQLQTSVPPWIDSDEHTPFSTGPFFVSILLEIQLTFSAYSRKNRRPIAV